MTDQLTDEEKAYYEDKLGDANRIVTDTYPKMTPDFQIYLIAAVFGKIASPLYFLRQEVIEAKNRDALRHPKPDKVQEHNSGAPKQKTRFKKSKAPDAEGYTEFAREDYVKTDLGGVLQYLRAHPDARKRFKGHVYKLTDFDGRDWLWRQKEVPK